MKAFWNDNEGLSVTDFLGCVVVISYTAISAIGVFLPQYTASAEVMLDFLKTPVTLVLTGYFGKTIAAEIPSIRNKVTQIKAFLAPKKKEEE